MLPPARFCLQLAGIARAVSQNHYVRRKRESARRQHKEQSKSHAFLLSIHAQY